MWHRLTQCGNLFAVGSMVNVCSYVYFSQPPYNISCDIYNTDRIFLECSAISLESANYTLKWYYERRPIINASISNFSSIIEAPGIRTYFQISRLGLEPLEIIPGYYYCQIELTDNNTDIEFEPSNKVYLGEEQFYQNKTFCMKNIFKTEDDKVAHTNCTIATTTGEITGSPNVTTSPNGFPVWGYIVSSVAALIILVSMLTFFLSLHMCIKHSRTTDQKRQTVPMATCYTEETSEQTSTSTDHTYEELDTFITGVEQRQQHIPISINDLDLATEPRNNTNQGTYNILLPAKFNTKVENQSSYDQLDPQMDSNLSYEISTQDLMVFSNKAYNKRDELDPQTSACLAYNMHPPQAQQ